MSLPFRDRAHAGEVLARALRPYHGRDDVIVLALPRGGVPVGAVVAEHLDAPLDIMLVRKLGVPGHEELAMGAIASGGVRVLNEDIAAGIGQQRIDDIADREQRELQRREQAYRGDHAFPDLSEKCVMLVDDGLATGSTMHAAVKAARQHNPAQIVVAVPVGPSDSIQMLRAEADDAICPETPRQFFSIGQFYQDFAQTTDEQVRELLERAAQRTRAGSKPS